MKNLKIFFISILVLFLFFPIFNVQSENEDKVDLYMFYGQGCSHCNKLRLFLEEMEDRYPALVVNEYEVYHDNEGRELFEKMSNNFDASIDGVPTVFIDDKVIVGFSNSIGELIEEEIIKCLNNKCGGSQAKKIDTEIVKFVGDSSPTNDSKSNNFSKKLTIPIVILAATVDAINPCAFAVLIILMTAALSIANKKRALKFGLAFSASIYLSYFLMGLGLFSALQTIGISHGFYIFVIFLAVIVGLLNIKDYFWYGKGFLMEVPLSWRPAMKKILRSATSPWGAFVVGLAISLFELPCTGGPYIVILGLLAKEVTRDVGIFYLLLYNLVFVSPLIILSLIIYKGFSTTKKLEKIRQGKLKILHLIAGILMLAIAVVMIISVLKGLV